MNTNQGPYSRLDTDGYVSKLRGYDTALVCEQGHVINEHVVRSPEDNASFCEECGAKAVSACECGAPIRGQAHGVLGGFEPPAHCRNCGQPHVWTQRKAEALKELLAEIGDISSDELKELIDVVPDVITETDRTEIAAVRFGKLCEKVAQKLRPSLVDMLKQIGTAGFLKVFLKMIGLDN